MLFKTKTINIFICFVATHAHGHTMYGHMMDDDVQLYIMCRSALVAIHKATMFS